MRSSSAARRSVAIGFLLAEQGSRNGPVFAARPVLEAAFVVRAVAAVGLIEHLTVRARTADCEVVVVPDQRAAPALVLRARHKTHRYHGEVSRQYGFNRSEETLCPPRESGDVALVPAAAVVESVVAAVLEASQDGAGLNDPGGYRVRGGVRHQRPPV